MSFKLSVAGKAQNVPYPVLIAVNFINSSDVDVSIPIEFVDDKTVDSKDSIKLVTPGGETFIDQLDALDYLSQTLPELLPERSKSQEWIKFALTKLYVKNFKELAVDLEKLDQHLNFRSFIVGYQYSLADIAIWVF